MNKKQLFWIIPLFIIIGFIIGGIFSYNYLGKLCNNIIEFRDNLNKIDCQLNYYTLNLLQLYEKNCKNYYDYLHESKLTIFEELKKNGLEEMKED